MTMAPNSLERIQTQVFRIQTQVSRIQTQDLTILALSHYIETVHNSWWKKQEGWILQLQEDPLPVLQPEQDQNLFCPAGLEAEEEPGENILLCQGSSTQGFASCPDSLCRGIEAKVLESVKVFPLNRLNRRLRVLDNMS